MTSGGDGVRIAIDAEDARPFVAENRGMAAAAQRGIDGASAAVCPAFDCRSENRDVAEELADLIFVAVCLANSMGIDLDEAFGAAMTKYRVRDADRWTRK